MHDPFNRNAVPQDQDVAGQVRGFILANFLFDRSEIDTYASLMEAGILDSTGVVELVAFLESHFAIAVADEEMVPENLDSVAGIVRFVQRKTGR